MDTTIKILLLALWLIEIVHSKTEDNSRGKELLPDALSKILLNRNSGQMNTDDHLLVEKWQDHVLANAVLANYLNILTVHASKADFSLLKQSNHCTIYVKTPSSFRNTILQLNNDIRLALLNLYGDLMRVQSALDNFPMHLKTSLLLLAKGNQELIEINLPMLIKKGETLVNESLIILKNPKAKIQQIQELLVELESLVSTLNIDYAISSQITDIKTQWILFNNLFNQVSIQAENAIQDFLLQFNWILEKFMHLDIDSHRDLILNLLQSKVFEIERSIDLIKIISQTSVDIWSAYTSVKVTDNVDLIHLTTDQTRKEAIKRYQYELQPIAIKFARLALQRHDEYLERTENREKTYEDFLNDTSMNDLNLLLSISS